MSIFGKVLNFMQQNLSLQLFEFKNRASMFWQLVYYYQLKQIKINK